jgi:hypothetical protein
MKRDPESRRYWARKRANQIYFTLLTVVVGYMLGEFIALLTRG